MAGIRGYRPASGPPTPDFRFGTRLGELEFGGFWRFVFGQLRGVLQKKIDTNALIGGEKCWKRAKTCENVRQRCDFLQLLRSFEEAKTGLIDFVPAVPEVRWRCGVDPPWADFQCAAILGLIGFVFSRAANAKVSISRFAIGG